jgi:hypothetical protein
MAVAYWVEQMGQDEEQKAAERSDRILEAELALWHGEVGLSLDALAMGASPEKAMELAMNDGSGGVWAST